MNFNRFIGVLTIAILGLAMFGSRPANAQDQVTANQFISGRVLSADGALFVMLPPARVGFDKFLNFYDKSFFTAKVGGTYYTNNNVITGSPANMRYLGAPNQLFIVRGAPGIGTGHDTVRCIWSSRNGVDIIQDCWPYAFTKSGQVVIRWSFKNLDSSQVVPIQVQWLNDIDITDPYEPTQPNSNDGPIFLHQYGYHDQWQQFPNTGINNVPWFYICFLFNLPGPAGKPPPGLSAMGYLDYSILGTTKPSRITMGDWFTLADNLFGPPPNYNTLKGTKPGPDDAILLEFPPTAASKNRTVVGGITSYGTGEYEQCDGNMFGLLFYPHKIDWNKSTMKYTPSPFKVELYAFNPSQFNAAANSHFTLTVCDHESIWDSLGVTYIGQSQTQPTDPAGVFISAGNVEVFDWYVKADPVYFCMGDYTSCLKISGKTGLGDPTYVTPGFNDTCVHDVIIGCAETDTLPPLHDTKVYTEFGKNDSISVHDDRADDKGLKKITWIQSSGPANNFVVDTLTPILPCFNDKAKHLIVIQQIDSLIGGCIDFKFEDCLGNESDTTVCFPAHPKSIVPDTLKPAIKITKYGSYDPAIECNSRLDSIVTSDFRQYDKGLENITWLDSSNMYMEPPSKTFSPPYNLGPFRFGIHVIDSMQDGHFCLRIEDGATPTANFTDTCVYYCTIHDTLAPRISITQTSVHPPTWTVCVREDAPWDRLIDKITIPNAVNMGAPTPPLASATGLSYFCFDLKPADTTLASSFCIKATDLAGNVSGDTSCASSSVDTDARKPNIAYSPDPSTNPTQLQVNIDDIHFNDPPANTSKYVWDTGIDSVWFTWGPDPANHGITEPWLPQTGKKFNCDTTALAPITLSVVDTLNADSIPTCITIHARDCQGNDSSWTWCYPFTPDLAPPNIIAKYIDKRTIQIVLSDDSTYDRGLRTVKMSPNTYNLENVNLMLNRLPDTTFTMTRTNTAQSAFGTVSSVDYWGTLFIAQMAQHQATADVQYSVQDFAIPKGQLTREATTFDLPITLVANDTVALARKGIRSFSFNFTLSGDVAELTFSGVKTIGTLTANGWTVTPTQVGNTVTINASSNTGASLSQASALDTTVMYLSFTTGNSESTHDVTININPNTERLGPELLVYNDYRDTLIKGLNGLSTMPPPFGSINGSHIVIVGSCSPSLQAGNRHPSVVSMDLPTPNPASKSVTLHYTVPHESSVQIAVYDMLGRQVKDLYNGIQTQGAYEIGVDVRDISEGEYTVRLEAAGSVVTRKITVRK